MSDDLPINHPLRPSVTIHGPGLIVPTPFAPQFTVPRLSDEDVERIARRVVELIGRRPLRVLPRREPHISPTLLDLADDDEEPPPP